jgi:transcription initiation factor TFIIIB Brf1 subunit/transcription initiation factor TFIIB
MMSQFPPSTSLLNQRDAAAVLAPCAYARHQISRIEKQAKEFADIAYVNEKVGAAYSTVYPLPPPAAIPAAWYVFGHGDDYVIRFVHVLTLLISPAPPDVASRQS